MTKALRILLLGKGGQVGWELQRALAPLGELVALDFDSTDMCGDFTNPAGLAETVRAVRPDVIVNAAAHTAVDKAESEPELARTINAVAPGVLATEAASESTAQDPTVPGFQCRHWRNSLAVGTRQGHVIAVSCEGLPVDTGGSCA